MKLRSGTTIISKKTNNKSKIDISLNKITDALKIHKNSEKTIENLKHIKTIYNILNDEFFVLYKDMSEIKMVRFVITIYKKTLQLMSDLILKTYDNKSLSYTCSEKEMIVTVLYNMNEVFIRIRGLMHDLIDSSDYMKKLLKTSEENKGKPIEYRNSLEAQTYYCYSHLYCNNEINEYNIHTYEDGKYTYEDGKYTYEDGKYTYEDGKYTYEEIYDYYYGNNPNKNEDDDIFVFEDYGRWFEYEDNISHYNEGGYKRYTELPVLYNYDELRVRIEFHKEELKKYNKIMETSYPHKNPH